MSGAVGLQGRYATSFGYGPRLGVGRYPTQGRGEQTNALLQAAGPLGVRNPAATPVVPIDNLPMPALETPQAAAATPVAASGGGGMGNTLMSVAPSLLALVGPYAYRKLFGDQPAGTGVSDGYSQFASDIGFNTGAGLAGSLSAPPELPLSSMIAADPGAMASLPGTFTDFPSGTFPDFNSVPDNLFSNVADTGFAGGGVDAGGFAPDMGPPMPAGDWLSGMDWSVTTPGTGAFGLDVGLGPVTINPITMAAGMLGSWGGGKLASSLVQGDEQQGWGSTIGGTVGGGLGGIAASTLAGSAFGPVGALIGAFLGALGGGTLAAGEPDFPYGYTGASVGYGDNGPELNFWSPNASNGGDASQIGGMGNALREYITGRASQEGYVINPEMINRGAFSAGYTNAPGGKFFVGGLGTSPSTAAYEKGGAYWRGNSAADIPGEVWNSLISANVLARPGSFTPWADVWAQVSQPQAIWSGGEPGEFITGYTSPDQNVWSAPSQAAPWAPDQGEAYNWAGG